MRQIKAVTMDGPRLGTQSPRCLLQCTKLKTAQSRAYLWVVTVAAPVPDEGYNYWSPFCLHHICLFLFYQITSRLKVAFVWDIRSKVSCKCNFLQQFLQVSHCIKHSASGSSITTVTEGQFLPSVESHHRLQRNVWALNFSTSSVLLIQNFLW